MTTFLKNIRKNWFLFFPVLILVIFIISIWDRNFYIGGDLINPLNPQNNILKSIYLWEEENGGLSFFKYMYLFWQVLFYLPSLFHIPADIGIKIFITFFYIIGFVFAYLTYKILFKGTKYDNKILVFTAAIIFILNPSAILVLIGSYPLYSFPVCSYFLLKYLEKRNLFLLLPFAFFFGVGYLSDLPQAKNLMTFSAGFIFLIILFKFLRKISFRSLVFPLFLVGFFTFFLNAVISVPFLSDAFGSKGVFKQYSQAVGVYDATADVPSSSLPFIMRFYNSDIVNSVSVLGRALSSPFFIIWTFFLWLLILLFCVKVKENREKKIVYFILIIILFYFFLAKGANPPFGEVYKFLLFNLPVFKVFRTSSTAVLPGSLFFAFLLGISFYPFLKKHKTLFCFIILIHVLIFRPVYLGYRLYDAPGGNASEKGVPIPKEYFQMAKRLDELAGEAKILSLPLDDGYSSKNWGYMGSSIISWLTYKPFIHGSAITASKTFMESNEILRKMDDNQACQWLKVRNIGYILYEKDSLENYPDKTFPFSAVTIFEDNYFLLKKVSGLCQAPHLYLPTKIIYYQGSINNLFSFGSEGNNNLMFYQAGTNPSWDQKILEKSQQLSIESLPTNIIFDMRGRNYDRLFFGNENLVDELFYPYVKTGPDSLFYPFVLWKEKIDEQLASKDKKKLFDKELFFGVKRISEIKKWGINNQWWQDNLKRFEQKMSAAINLAGNFGIKQDNLELVAEYLDRERTQIKTLSETTFFWNKEKITAWNQAFDQLEQEINKAYDWPQFSQIKYVLNVPVLGKYNLFLGSDDQTLFDGKKDLKITLNNLTTKVNSPQLGEVSLSNLQNSLELNIGNQPNMIDPKLWQVFNGNYQIRLALPQIQFENVSEGLNTPKNNAMISQKINNWQPQELYLLKIKYQTLKPDSLLHLLIKEKKNQYSRLQETWVSQEIVIFGDVLDGKDEYQVLIKSDKESLGATLYLYSKEGSIVVDDVNLTRVYLPSLSLTMNLNFFVPSTPLISFKKVNPVKYQITVKNAQSPFFLIFSETFDKGWKIYSDGKSIEEKNHFLVNGYANAWYLEKTGDQEFTIEYWPQRLFYLGLAVSLLTFLFLSGYSLFKFFKERKISK